MAGNCITGIAANIIDDCSDAPISGLEITAYAMNRTDIASVTYDAANNNLVTGITMKTGTQAYKIQGHKRNMNAGHDIVTSETAIDKFTHFFSFQPWQIDAPTVNALDGLGDVVVIVERKNKGQDGNGAFKIYGLQSGLYKSSDTERANDEDGNRLIELTSQDGMEEPTSSVVFYDTSYDTTKTAAEALLEAAI